MDFLVSLFWYTVPFIVVLSILIFVHEFGHYIVAKWCGVKIEEFSMGFGKKLCSRTDKSGTVWKICAVPFGGYVKMFGDADGASTPDNKKLKKMSKKEKALSFQHKKVYQRFAIVLAGPAFNYFFAVLCFILLFMVWGEQFSKPTISEVRKDSAAYSAGIEVGDNVVSFGGQEVEKFEDIKRIASLNFGKTMSITVERNSEAIELEITPETIESVSRFGEVHKEGVIGVLSTEIEFVKYGNPLRAISQSFKYSNQMITGTLQALGQMIMGTRSGAELGGPLKIAKLSKDFASQGVASLIYFIGVLSVNLALINMFPIPVLDGGHLLFFAIEGVVRRPVPEKVQDILYKIGLYFLLTFAVVITFNDLKSLAIFDFIKNLFYK
jgi:regulator of sigma E protease